MHNMDLIVSDKKMKLPIIVKIIFICFIFFLLFSLNKKMSIYNIYESRVIERDGDYFVQAIVSVDEKDVFDNNEILIDNKKYKYKLESIENDYVYDGNKIYMLVNISIDLDDKYKFNNNYLKLKQLKKKELLFTLIFNELKKGMNL